MEWALAILFGAAILLLILSFYMTKQPPKSDQLEKLAVSFMEEVQSLEKQIRNIELDAEITAHEAGVKVGSSEKRALLREVLDLYKRGYSITSIAEEKRLPINEVKFLLSPYMERETGRGSVANDS